MRPTVRFLSDDLIKQIIDEAKSLLCDLGMKICSKELLSLLADHRAEIDMDNLHARFTEDIIDKGLKTAPESIQLYDVMGNQTHDFSGHNVHFTPGSSALYFLDGKTQQVRNPTTHDYIDFCKIVSQLDTIAATSTAFIPADVNEKIFDSYRLFLSLLYCEKPVVTGTFNIESFKVMKDFQVAVRGLGNQSEE